MLRNDIYLYFNSNANENYPDIVLKNNCVKGKGGFPKSMIL